MPKALYIFILIVVACCRIASVASPFVDESSAALVAWHDQECNNEDGEMEKAKQEPIEDTWFVHIAVVSDLPSVATFITYSDNNLLKRTCKPVTPPPNPA